MAVSMVKSCTQFSFLRQCLMDNVCYDPVTNRILQILCTSYIQRQCYHATPICLKSKVGKQKALFKTLYDTAKQDNINIEQSKKKSLPLIQVWENMTVTELATSANRNIDDVLDALHIAHRGAHYRKNNIITNKIIMYDVVKKLGCRAKTIARPNQNVTKEIKYVDIVKSTPPDESVLVKRHPVVTIMGHVDHGKTTLLDALRDTRVVDTEFGGITQHIGAFNVFLKSGQRVTFLDTPGHAAFTSMRFRGAHVTDIVVLVVAADDGVKEQTLQSIEMAKDANVPIIVAINKIDKPNADIKRTEKMLAEHGIVVETLGGDVQCINISALKKMNLEDLTEAIILQAELMNLKGDPSGSVEGVIIECTNSVGRGKLVTALIKRGTLKKGCLLVSGLVWAKVRAMFNDAGRPVLEAKPADAVQIIGWRELPNVGDEVLQVENEKTLNAVLKHRGSERDNKLAMEHKEAADKREETWLKGYKKLLAVKRSKGIYLPSVPVLDNHNKSQHKDDNSLPLLNVILKGDVVGSVEAILDIFDTYTEDNLCRLNIVHYGIGPVTETDIELAELFNAVIYRFNVNASPKLEEEAKRKGLSIRFFNVIYKLFDDIKNEINGKLPEIDVEEILGEANVQQNFQITEGKLASLRHLKEEVSSIKVNGECGLRLEDSTISFQHGDKIICFKLYKKTQNITWDPGF
ncbi:mitochondrial translation initiation factor 2 isoform X2 [Calliopsis andreniformis]|uniref:mitochondrial translation initiation factor 2 isoform X2 n=1 Tax=Calliopsis andreniformis TaxID=337506 RepID=UPI003FCDE906